jgi:hypothetical protein
MAGLAQTHPNEQYLLKNNTNVFAIGVISIYFDGMLFNDAVDY